MQPIIWKRGLLYVGLPEAEIQAVTVPAMVDVLVLLLFLPCQIKEKVICALISDRPAG